MYEYWAPLRGEQASFRMTGTTGIKVLKKADLSHKFVALFGCGDSDSYSDTFCDGIGILYEELKDTHCTFCGATDPSGYTFDSSVAVINGKFVGLPLDEVNEDGKTDERIAQWTEALKKNVSTNLKTPTNVMAIERKVPGEIRIFLNHVYEFKKENTQHGTLYDEQGTRSLCHTPSGKTEYQLPDTRSKRQ